MDLRALAIPDGALSGYISLGVVEHDPAGPDAILAEARRVLAPGGVLIVSVPYVNGVRRLAATWIRRRNREIAQLGGAFYQSVFSRAELVAALARCGFSARAVHPYDPARILRQALRPLLRRVGRRVGAMDGEAPAAAAPGPERQRPLAAIAKRLLYTEPALRLLGHMLLVVARKT
jgi:SAM-dependent methyltransferase